MRSLEHRIPKLKKVLAPLWQSFAYDGPLPPANFNIAACWRGGKKREVGTLLLSRQTKGRNADIRKLFATLKNEAKILLFTILFQVKLIMNYANEPSKTPF